VESAVRSPQKGDPARALEVIVGELREGGTLVSACVVEAQADPALGVLAAAGPRAASAPGAYARVIESVREGYLLHYGEPRVVATGDRDLALLAGDYLYARGLALLASFGDLDAVRVLAELISLCAHAGPGAGDDVAALWLAGAVAIAAGDEPAHAAAKETLWAGGAAAEPLWTWAATAAAREGLDEQLGAAAKTVGFQATERG
jgi:hypothetical protein